MSVVHYVGHMSNGANATTEHTHEYRRDIADWWCVECDTVTDYCQWVPES